jgi:hypothetical protein
MFAHQATKQRKKRSLFSHKYNSGIVIVYEIFRKLLPYSGAPRQNGADFAPSLTPLAIIVGIR